MAETIKRKNKISDTKMEMEKARRRENFLCRDIIKKRFAIKWAEKVERKNLEREMEILKKKLEIDRKNIENCKGVLRILGA